LKSGHLELFEDLDIRDPEFEHWVRDQRTSLASSTPAFGSSSDGGSKSEPGNPVVLIERASNLSSDEDWIFRTVSTLISQSLMEHGDVRIIGCGDPNALRSHRGNSIALALRLAVRCRDGMIHLIASIDDLADGSTKWQFQRRVNPTRGALGEDTAFLLHLVRDVVDRVLQTIEANASAIRAESLALVFYTRARREIFGLEPRALAHADQLLQRAYSIDPRPTYLSWRYFLRNISFFEHRSDSFLQDRIDRLSLAEQALRDAPSNTIVLAFAAQAELVCASNPSAALHFASESVERNPSNALGWAILSNAQLAVGDYAAGDRSARIAQDLMNGSEQAFFFNIYSCMGAVAVGDYDRAIHLAQRAIILSPHFKPPMRYLAALYKHTGRKEELIKLCERMRNFEPDFRLGSLLEPSYPVSTLQRLPLIQSLS
jgi:tetratricopeptide (TPR) repeat protein